MAWWCFVDVEGWLGPSGALHRLRGERFEDRPGQRALAEGIARTLAEGGVLLAEAGTGVGKSLAYLLPALLDGRRVVVSTATRALQDQLASRDVPLLARLLGRPLEAVVVKGIGNYACRRRLERVRSGGEEVPSLPPALDAEALLAWAARSEWGDLSELAALPEGHAMRSFLQAASDRRLGALCPHFGACFVTRLRRRAEAAEVVITNHHLYLADLQLRAEGGGAQVLPDHEVAIFDEAHRLEPIATAFFGVDLSRIRITRLVADLRRALHGRQGGEALAQRLAEGVGVAFEDVLVRLSAGSSRGSGGRLALPPEALEASSVRSALAVLHQAFEHMADWARQQAGTVPEAASLLRRLQRLRRDLERIEEAGSGRWVAWVRTGRGGEALAMGASPVEVGELLRERLFEALPAVVLTSATLSVGGRFGYVRRRLGLGREEPGVAVRELHVGSPFDHARQAALYLPSGLPAPGDPGWLDAATEEGRRLIALAGGGVFFLCTSVRAMHGFAERLGPSAPGPWWVQGDAPKGELLARFREARHGVLFATLSFWEGVDVPGESLRMVILDKLPFDAPDDAVVQARLAACRARGANPFREEQLPVAALTLRQGFGRLLRRRDDRGVVAVLDPRLRTRGYGKWLLRSLPPARRCTHFDALRAFWQEAFGQKEDDAWPLSSRESA